MQRWRAALMCLCLAFLPARGAAAAAEGGPGPSAAGVPYTHTDRLIVRFKDNAANATAAHRLRVADRLQGLTRESLAPLRTMADGSHVVRLSRRMAIHEVQAIAAQLAGDPDVLDVLPDRLYFPQATPTDPQYASQWNLSAANGINLPAAWDITTGNPSQVIAILDTGMLPHNDLAGRWIGGYDFVSLTERSNDGNLRDADSTDPGDWVTAAESASGPLAGCPVTDSRWHGTAMAGVIAAAANNGQGIAGINWQGKILPVRVVGKCGGYESDIADAIRWSVGIAVPGIPNNPNPARVINLSLAAAGACSTLMQGAIDDANTPIVTAAGNLSADAAGYSPGNCSGVITVGAVDRNGGKPVYANFGSGVSVSAPGGIDSTNNNAINVLTTQNQGLTTASANNDFYRTTFGTSVATAQVTGVASLILGINPTLSPQSVKEILQNTARVFPTGTTAAMPNPSQADCTTALCGAGIINAASALAAAQKWGQSSVAITGADYHSMVLGRFGRLIGWGSGTYIGNGTTGLESSPVPATQLAGITRLSVYFNHTLAMRADGSVWAWGTNSTGEIGDGTATVRTLPVRVAGALIGVQIREIAAGAQYSLALAQDGRVWAWGVNSQGQLGDGTVATRYAPVLVAGLTNVVAIAAGQGRSIAVKSDGTVWEWGSSAGSVPVQVTGLPSSAIAAAAGNTHSIFLLADGTVWAKGANQSGLLGDGTNTARSVPVQVVGLTGVTRIAAQNSHSMALRNDGTIWSWGGNAEGKLGDGTFESRNVAVPVQGLSGVEAIGIANNRSFAIKPDGTVWAWGSNSGSAGLGIGTVGGGDQPLPVLVANYGGGGYLDLGPADPLSFAPQTDVPMSSLRTSNAIRTVGIAGGAAISISAGEYSVGCNGTFASGAGTINNNVQVCVRLAAGSVCGVTTSATLAIAGFPQKIFAVTTIACDSTPEQFDFVTQGGVAPNAIIGSNTVTITGINTPVPISIAGGYYEIGCVGLPTNVMSTISNGQSVCVGQQAPATNNTLTTVSLNVGSLTRPFHFITAVDGTFSTAPVVDGNDNHQSFALRTDGTLVGWGDAANMGNGGGGTVASTQLTTLSGVTRLSTFYAHTLALRSDGTVWSWGTNGSGQLGNGSLAARSTPGLVAGPLSGATIIAVSAGKDYSLALKSDGTVWGWGTNTYGELGDGTLTDRLQPVQVPGLANVVAIAAGGARSIAVLNDGTVWEWGNGNGTAFQVSGLTGIVAAARGLDHTLYLGADGRVWSRGNNASGQLGYGNQVDNFGNPMQVPGISSATRIAVGFGHSMALLADGTVMAWGSNGEGELGDGSGLDRSSPVPVPNLSGVIAIGAGSLHSLAVKIDGSVWAWGYNSAGVVGNGSPVNTHQLTVAQVLGTGGTGNLNVGAFGPSSFAPQTDVAPSSVRTSNAIVISGITDGAAIVVSGGAYSLGCTSTFVSTSGTINNNGIVCVRQTSAPTCGTTTTTTLSITGTSAKTFSVTTLACDLAPDPFNFVPQAGAAPGAVATSNTVTISGINTAVPIAVTGGTYSIGCTASFVSTASSIGSGQTVCVRLTAALSGNTRTSATLTVGSISRTFDVFTAVGAAFSTPPRVDGGQQHSLGLRSDGSVFAWGLGSMLGASGQPTSPTPVLVNALGGITMISTSTSHALALRSDGSVWAWGDNASGQLGDGTTQSRTSPGIVGGALAGANVIGIVASGGSSLALKSDGTVWAWGANAYGQLGDGTTSTRISPVPVLALSGITALSLNGAYAAAVRNDGSVWEWGGNNSLVPVQVSGLPAIVSTVTGSHRLYLAGNGAVWASGVNFSGQLGDGTTADHAVPAQVAGLSGVTRIAAGYARSLALRNDGTVWAWGDNHGGQLGDGTNIDKSRPVQVLGLTGITEIGAGFDHSLAIQADGSVWAWGNNSDGQLGTGIPVLGTVAPGAANLYLPMRVLGVGGNDFLSLQLIDTYPDTFAFLPAFGTAINATVASSPIIVSGLGAGVMSPITISGGSYAINGGGFTTAPGTVVNGNSVVVRVQSSGAYASTTFATLTIGGPTGRASTFYVRTRRDPNGAALVPQVALGNSHSSVLNSDGTVYAAGYNGNGQLGNGTTFGTSVMRPVAGLARVMATAAGAHHGLALRDDGTVAAWGYNAAGQLGHGQDVNSERNIVNVSNLTNVIAIAAGDYHSLALKGDGSVWAWGLNVDGQIGQGSTTTSRYLTPVPVTGLSGVIAIAAGGRHNLAVLANGSVVAWGANASGQLGDGSTTDRSAPVPVATLAAGVLAVYAGGAHSLALKTDSRVMSWGNNDFGQLGDGTLVSQSTPVAVTALGTGVAQLAAGANHSLAVKVGGALYSWGANTNSQLGDNGVLNRSTPYLVTTVPNVIAIAAGARHSAALTVGRKLNLWGDNYFGQVGNKSGNYSPHSGSLNVLRGDAQISEGVASASSSIGTSSVSGAGLLELNGLAASFSFGKVTSGQLQSAPGRFKNTAANDSLSGINVSVTGTGFGLTGDSCSGATLGPQTDCTFNLQFTPPGALSYGGSVTLSATGLSDQTYAIDGEGQPPAAPILVLPELPAGKSTLGFESAYLGTPTSAQTILVKNGGTAGLHINSPAAPVDFPLAGNTCTGTIAANATCQIDLTFTPTGIGPRSAVMTLASDGGSVSVTLSGTGVYSATAPLTLIAAQSRKRHAGITRDLPLVLNQPITGAIAVEPRMMGPNHQIVFQFSGPVVQPGTATVIDPNSNAIGTVVGVGVGLSGNEVVVTLTGVPDNRRVTVSLANVNGNTPAQVSLGFLIGDVTGSQAVNASDIAAMKARLNQPVDANNAKYDLNLGNTLTAADLSVVKARSGTVMP